MSYGFNSDKSKFPLGLASDLPDPTKPPMQIIGELQNQIIDSASIENGATASKSYASGDYVCFQGALCKASKAISQGDTLSIGASANDNLTLTDAAAEFTRINSDLINMKIDGTIYQNIINLNNIVADYTNTVSFTMPKDGYVYASAGASANNTTKTCILVIRIPGKIRLFQSEILDKAYADIATVTPMIKKGTTIEVYVALAATSWASAGEFNVNIL